MAELNESESTKDTKKTKKEKKMEEKAAKKAAKKAKKNHEADKPDAENDDSDSVSSKIVMVLVTILIIAIWLGIFAVFVKADVGGFGSTVLAPALKDVPVLSKILPDSGNITASESTETAGYTNLDDAVSRIKELEKQLDDANSKNQADAQTINDLNAQIQDLSTYKEEQAAFEEEKEKYGLIDAIDKFNLEKNVKFETYASLRIRGAILDQIRKMDWIPRTVRQRQRKIDEAIKNIELRTGKTANDADLAKELSISEDELCNWQSQLKVTNVVSLDEFDESGPEPVMDAAHNSHYAQPEEIVTQEELKTMLVKSLDNLTEKERRVIELYYYEDLTLKEISNILEVSESRVSQLHTKGLIKMRKVMGPYMNILTNA